MPDNSNGVPPGQDLIAVGGEVIDSRVSLCIYHQQIDIPAINKLLACQPTHAHERGYKKTERSVPAKVGLWALEAPKGMLIPDAIRFLLDTTTTDRKPWLTLSEEHRINLRLGIFLRSWNEGFDLPLSMICEIAERHWSMGFDLYSAEGEETIDGFLSQAHD
jgi:hypothetical protein